MRVKFLRNKKQLASSNLNKVLRCKLWFRDNKKMAYNEMTVVVGGLAHVPIVIGLLKLLDGFTAKSYKAELEARAKAEAIEKAKAEAAAKAKAEAEAAAEAKAKKAQAEAAQKAREAQQKEADGQDSSIETK